MKEFKMNYSILSGETENEGITMATYGVKLVQTFEDGRENVLEIENVTVSQKRIESLLSIMERGFVTPMTAYEIIEDFLEM